MHQGPHELERPKGSWYEEYANDGQAPVAAVPLIFGIASVSLYYTVSYGAVFPTHILSVYGA